MAAAPELPFLAAGAVAMVGQVKSVGRFPDSGITIVIATFALVVMASLTGGTRIAPLVRAIGLLALLGASFGAVRAYTPKGKVT